MGPPTDPGPLGSARVSKWSIRPLTSPQHQTGGSVMFYMTVILTVICL
ncbi:unnamed protein product [Staurois parvus]|uniref:Uncharacterized protein n=1 Tax=Staurois parvus TaxID=386267 RepID=A0ABN9CX99_9NEOB|nr:unnamed protein product [Staurois parvus]